MCFRIKRKVLSGFRQFEAFDELIFAENQIGLASAPPKCNVLNARRLFLCCVAAIFLHVGVHESFNVELSKHEFRSSFVVADHPHVVVGLAGPVLLLWGISGRVVHLHKAIFEDKAVGSLGRAMTRFTVLLPAPSAHKESQRSEGIGSDR